MVTIRHSSTPTPENPTKKAFGQTYSQCSSSEFHGEQINALFMFREIGQHLFTFEFGRLDTRWYKSLQTTTAQVDTQFFLPTPD